MCDNLRHIVCPNPATGVLGVVVSGDMLCNDGNVLVAFPSQLKGSREAEDASPVTQSVLILRPVLIGTK